MANSGKANFYPVILAGGRGTRFWPLSRKRLAKQLLPLNSKKSMIQETVERLSAAGEGETILDHHQRRPARRDRAAAQEAATRSRSLPNLMDVTRRRRLVWRHFCWSRRDPDAVIGMFPSDHVILEREAFSRGH